LPAIQTTHETTRGLRLPFNFASMVAFPPENLVTLLAPNVFGEMAKYWGRWYLWETSLFIGVSGLALAVYAAIRCDLRIKLPALVIILVSLLLALGVYTPLFRFLYVWVPGFDRFRSVSKFIFPASLFIILLAATGFDQLLRGKTAGKAFVAAVFAGAVALGLVAWWVGHHVLARADEHGSRHRRILSVSATLLELGIYHSIATVRRNIVRDCGGGLRASRGHPPGRSL
jgi:hypothetical protein